MSPVPIWIFCLQTLTIWKETTHTTSNFHSMNLPYLFKEAYCAPIRIVFPLGPTLISGNSKLFIKEHPPWVSLRQYTVAFDIPRFTGQSRVVRLLRYPKTWRPFQSWHGHTKSALFGSMSCTQFWFSSCPAGNPFDHLQTYTHLHMRTSPLKDMYKNSIKTCFVENIFLKAYQICKIICITMKLAFHIIIQIINIVHFSHPYPHSQTVHS